MSSQSRIFALFAALHARFIYLLFPCRLGNVTSTLTRASSSAGVVVTTISRANEAHDVINSLMNSLRERLVVEL